MGNTTKTLLLLGAGTDQCFAIKTAKAMGHYVVVVDGNPNAAGFEIADEYAVVSTRDLIALKTFVDEFQAKGKSIDGVSVMGSDISQFVAKLAQYIGAPHIPVLSAEIATDKYLMKKCFLEKDVPIPWFQMLNDYEDLKSVIKNRGLPLIIKPTDRSGARGVFLLTESSDIEALYEHAKAESFSNTVMVESYLAGPQISTESIMYEGKAYTPGFVDRNYDRMPDYLPFIIEDGGWEPSRVTQEQRLEVELLVEQAALALGVTDGVVKGDIVLTESGPKVIEMATRLSGGDFSESLVPLGTGVNYVESAINIALGIKPDLNSLRPKFQQAVANRYFFPPAGKLVSIKGLDKVRAKPFVEKLEIWYQVGDFLPTIRSHADRFGVFTVTASNLIELEERVTWVHDTVEINVDTSVLRNGE
nr:ATP-grasp domain-containing protein [Thalassotalea atypica]